MALILAVDDEPDVLATVEEILQRAGYDVMVASNGHQALEILATQLPDLVILDVMMPDLSGIEVCRRIRANPYWARLPVIFLTAKSRASDVVEGLDVGGDDYLTKPFEVIELPARINALLRRAPGGTLDTDSDYLEVGDLKLHTAQPEVIIHDQTIELTAVEHQLLHYLMVHAGQPISAERLLQDVWEYPPGAGNPNVVQVTIGRLRSKLEIQDDSPQYIRNVRGQGYLITN